MSGYGQVLHGGCTMILSKKKLGGVSLSFLQTRSGREVVLETESIEARRFTSEQLGNEVGLDCSGRTVQRAMGTMSYHKCTACVKDGSTNGLRSVVFNTQAQCCSVILSRKTGNGLNSAMKSTLVRALKGLYVSVSFKSPDNGIAMIVFRNDLS